MIDCVLNKAEEGVSPHRTTAASGNQECNAIPIHMQIYPKEAFKALAQNGEQMESWPVMHH